MPLYIEDLVGAENTLKDRYTLLEQSLKYSNRIVTPYSNRKATKILQKNYQMFKISIMHGAVLWWILMLKMKSSTMYTLYACSQLLACTL